ncbi:Kif3c [Scenedesmus sp. PABB004]|nr:Kif3c [Scenedesmus sp. PABB004]
MQEMMAQLQLQHALAGADEAAAYERPGPQDEDWAAPAEGDDNFKVVIRVRPPLPRELQGYREYQCTSLVDARSGRLITISENLPAVLSGAANADGLLYATYRRGAAAGSAQRRTAARGGSARRRTAAHGGSGQRRTVPVPLELPRARAHRPPPRAPRPPGRRFTFDNVYDQDSSQQAVYDQSARPLVLSTLQGYNAAIIAYGQTGTGKTYTMEGELEGPLRGIIPRSVEDIFAAIENDPEPHATKYLVRASYLQIYNEVISDLLKPEKVNLMIREDRRRGVFVDGLSEWVVRSPAEVYGLMMRGAQQVRAARVRRAAGVRGRAAPPAPRRGRRRGRHRAAPRRAAPRRPRAQRATGATKMNEVSSRSHAVCIIIVEKCTTTAAGAGGGGGGAAAAAAAAAAGMGMDGVGMLMAAAGGPSSRKAVAAAAALQQQLQHSIKARGAARGARRASLRGPPTRPTRPPRAAAAQVGKLNLVDLAGSERVHITGATGKRLEESKKINASLSALGNVIAALTDRKERAHIPYRDSKLTRILEDSLGGNCKTTMMCMISPAMEAFAESLSTLKFANRAKNIKNQAVVNEDADQRTLLRKYERELRRLRAELTRRNKELVDKRHLLEVEEQKRRAEADKLAALTALETASAEFMREKQEKKELEAKIAAMQSQLLIGGNKLEDIPAFRTLLAKARRPAPRARRARGGARGEHRRIRGEYEARLRELEAERHLVEEDLAQVDKYKQLLLKQRDIMIALTARLNERDEQIMTLQEELEAYDRHQRLLEDALDSKTAELIALRRAALEAAAANVQQSPGGDESAELVHQVKQLQLANAELQQQLQQQARAALAARTTGGGAVAAAAAAANSLAVVQQLQQQQAEAEHEAEKQAEELASMQVQLDFATKEKVALQTILAGKVLPLADELSAGLAHLRAAASSGGGSAASGDSGDAELGGAGERLAAQVTMLQRLLAATVAAMARASGTAAAR